MKIPSQDMIAIVAAIVGSVTTAALAFFAWIIRNLIIKLYKYKVKIEDPLINIKRNGKIIYQIDCLFRLRLYNGKNHTYGISNENIVIKFDKGSYEFPIFIASGVNMGDHIDLINLEPRNTYIIEGTCNIDDTIYEFLRKMKYIRSVYFKYQIGASGKYKKVKFKNIIMAGNNKFLLKYY